MTSPQLHRTFRRDGLGFRYGQNDTMAPSIIMRLDNSSGNCVRCYEFDWVVDRRVKIQFRLIWSMVTIMLAGNTQIPIILSEFPQWPGNDVNMKK